MAALHYAGHDPKYAMSLFHVASLLLWNQSDATRIRLILEAKDQRLGLLQMCLEAMD